MPVVEVTELYRRRGTQGADWKRTYTRVWQVITDSFNDGPRTVREALSVGLGMPYATPNESDNGAFVQSLSAECVSDDGLQWEVTVEYGPYQPLDRPQNPLDEQPTIAFSWAQFERPCDFDVGGLAILNSAGDSYDPPVMVDDPRPILQLVRNEASFDPALVHQYRNKVNSTSFFGADPGTVKVANITGHRVKHPDLGYYWEVSYEFANNDTWHVFVLEQGMRQLVPGTSTKKTILDTAGTKVTSPWPLAANGTALPVGSTPIFREWIVYGEVDFSVFGFDDFYLTLIS
jgi:hypothetical protein